MDRGMGHLTLSEDEVIALDELVKGALGQLRNVGVGRDDSSEGGQKASGDMLVLHCVLYGRGA